MNALIILLWIPFSLAIHAYVVACYWSWFMVPGFDLPPIRTPYLLGAALLISYTTFHNMPKYADEPEPAWYVIVTRIIMSAMALLIGKILHAVFV
jgi:hypothetical protein